MGVVSNKTVELFWSKPVPGVQIVGTAPHSTIRGPGTGYFGVILVQFPSFATLEGQYCVGFRRTKSRV